MDAFELIKTRRSTRKFHKRGLERELLDTIVETGRHAPSGSNSQTTHFFVITDPGVLEELAALVKNEFSHMEETPGMYRSIIHAIRASKGDSYVFHYNARCLL